MVVNWHNAETQGLPLRPKKEPSEATLDLYCLPEHEGILVKVTPPLDWDTAPTEAAATSPSAHPPHVPCDIVLVIDVSGSMDADAPVPTAKGEVCESHGLSVLDLVKHAARTICETLGDDDRLAIVTFDASATVLQALTPMTAEAKTATERAIEAMRPTTTTNLWHGILMGMRQFSGQGQDHHSQGPRVPAIMVLTDGEPNHMSPAQGYVPKLRTMMPQHPQPPPPPIHTFGFGYQLRSGLLKSISELTGGNYAFIPDAGMIGTVFVHAVANLQTTFATDAVVHLTTMPPNDDDDGGVTLTLTLTETLGEAVQRPPQPHHARVPPRAKRLTVNVGTLVYGQSRDIFLKYKYAVAPDAVGDGPLVIKAELEYGRLVDDGLRVTARCVLPGGTGDAVWVADEEEEEEGSGKKDEERPPLTADEAAFHVSRSMLCSFIASFFPLNDEEEHCAVPYRPSMPREVAAFAATLPAGQIQRAGDDSPMCKALMADVAGQVTMALTDPDHYTRWGRHYLPSLQGAHAVQQCNSFRDPGPLLYAAASPRFVACRNALDAAFDTLPPPQPSGVSSHRLQGKYKKKMSSAVVMRAPAPAAVAVAAAAPPPPQSCQQPQQQLQQPTFSMSRYHNARGPCFASFCRVRMASGGNGGKPVRVHRLRRGMQVQTPRGPRAVRSVLKTPVRSLPMVALGRLLVTAWHPVSHNGADWVFPCNDLKDQARRRETPPVRYTGCIYSILLEPDDDVDAHAVSVEGIWTVTLGHGLTEKANANNPKDVRIHGFLGDYAAVCRSLATLEVHKDGVVVNGGSTRSNYRQWHTRK